MEFCIGGDIGSMLEGGPLPEPLAQHYVAEIVTTLEYLHSIGRLLFKKRTKEKKEKTDQQERKEKTLSLSYWINA